MNTKKTNSYYRLLIGLFITVILIFTVGIVADGWQNTDSVIPEDENNGDGADDDSANADKNTETEKNEEASTPEEQTPTYIDPITGLETTEQLYGKRHMAFIFDSNSPLYGISSASLIIEMPVEEGRTRLLALINDYKGLGKIGSLASNRDYISRVIRYFSVTGIYSGKDGEIFDDNDAIDLSTLSGFTYTEYNSFIYTNGNLLEGASSSVGTQLSSATVTPPYRFGEYGSEKLIHAGIASRIILPFSDSESTELTYSESMEGYTLSKGGNLKTDLLTNEILSFDNCIVLFADSVTYETENGSSFTLMTENCGKGYYFTGGTYTAITYNNEDGCLKFMLDGEILAINRGTTYIGYLKSSSYNAFTDSLLNN